MLKSQKGFGVLAYGLAALAIVGALTGLVVAWKSYTSGLVEEGLIRGRAEVTAEVAQRDNAQLAAVVEKLRVAQVEKQMAERKAETALAAQSAKFKLEKQNAQKRTDDLVAAARAGTLVLRDPGTVAAGPAVGDRGTAGAGGPAAGGPEPGDADRLSVASVEFLLGLTSEADEVARKYNRLLGHYHIMESVCRGN